MVDGLKILGKMLGISNMYRDKMGKKHFTSDVLFFEILSGFGLKKFGKKSLDYEIEKQKNKVWVDGILPVQSFFVSDKIVIDFFIPNDCLEKEFSFILTGHDGNIFDGCGVIFLSDINGYHKVGEQKFAKLKLHLLGKFDPDYYNLEIRIEDKIFSGLIIIAPDKAYVGSHLEKGSKLLGVGVQLYALKSKTGMGIGDFTALGNIIKEVAKSGCDMVGVNPLGAMYLKSKEDVSPYRTFSREYLNYIYIDLSIEEDFKKSGDVEKLIKTNSYKTKLARLQNSNEVDYYEVFSFKYKILKFMYKYFKQNHISKKTKRAIAFENFKLCEGARLHNLCIFEAVLENEVPYFKNWGNGYDEFDSDSLLEFSKKNYDKIDFYAYSHWMAHNQLMNVVQLSNSLKMKIGLYIDMPVGAASNGCEVWSYHNNFVDSMDIGTPPDTIRPRGQTWGLVPPNPLEIIKNRYSEFISILVHSMQYAGAIRLDHAFGLMRLFFVDNRRRGAYVNYNMRDMVAILCLESHRHKCIVIGEDLGNVPDGFREFMLEHNILSNKILFRQKDKDGKFLSREEYPYLSLSQVSTHDQATSLGFWVGEDIETNYNCGLYPKEIYYKENLIQRDRERRQFFNALKFDGAFYKNEKSVHQCLDGRCVPDNISLSFNIFGARTRSAIYLIRIEDVFDQVSMENVPGTVDKYPNWRIKLPIFVDDFKKDARMQNFLKIIKQNR